MSRPQRPQTLGKIERFWGTLWRECWESAVFADLAEARRRIRALESENRTLRQQLTAAEVRRALAEVLPHLVHTSAEAVKKEASAPPPPPPMLNAASVHASPPSSERDGEEDSRSPTAIPGLLRRGPRRLTCQSRTCRPLT